MKKILTLCLATALSAAAVSATPNSAVGAPQTEPATVTVQDTQSLPRSDINCGFICDSFGRCYRVCW